MKQGRYHVNVRLRIREESEPIYGTGISELLQRCQERRSLHAASKEMHMPYRKALYVVKRAEQSFGQPILEKTIGGVGGGGSCLTAFGRDLVDRFNTLEAEVNTYTRQRMEALFPDYPLADTPSPAVIETED